MSRINLKKAAHHEEHKDHEDFSMGYVRLNAHPCGVWRFCDSQLFFFTPFVFFVVQMRF